LRALFGLRKHSGSIFLSGSPAKIGSPQEAIRRGVAYVPEDRKTEGLLVPRSVQFNMSLPSVPVLSRRLLTVNRTREAALVYDLMARLQVKAASVHQTIRRLSGGNQQKVALAKWLAMEPRLYLLDEPTRGIDVGTKREIYALLRKLADSGAAILMTSSDTMELVGLCDTIVVLFEGNVVTVLEGDDVTEENVVRACMLAARHEERESA
jgi:ribose transport system ATP-binding protein